MSKYGETGHALPAANQAVTPTAPNRSYAATDPGQTPGRITIDLLDSKIKDYKYICRRMAVAVGELAASRNPTDLENGISKLRDIQLCLDSAISRMDKVRGDLISRSPPQACPPPPSA